MIQKLAEISDSCLKTFTFLSDATKYDPTYLDVTWIQALMVYNKVRSCLAIVLCTALPNFPFFQIKVAISTGSPKVLSPIKLVRSRRIKELLLMKAS